MANIIIPENLKPLDGRFGCGPSRMRKEQLEAFAKFGDEYMGTSHRQAPIKALVGELKDGLSSLFRMPAGYEVILGNGGASAFWDVATHSLADKKAQALVHGEFGSKFSKILDTPWLQSPTVISAEPGTRGEFTPEADVDLYVYPHNETSTGVFTPVHRPAGISDSALMMTDATSAAGGIDFDMNKTDVYYFAPQKNLGSDGGIWFALASPKAIERIEKIHASGRYIPNILSAQLALDNSRDNFTLNTPALATLFFTNNQVQWINKNGGLKWADARTRRSSKILFDWAEKTSVATPFVKDPSQRSQVVATIDFEGVDANKISQVLRENGIVDTESYRKLGRNQMRVATFVSAEPSEFEALTACIDYVLERI